MLGSCHDIISIPCGDRLGVIDGKHIPTYHAAWQTTVRSGTGIPTSLAGVCRFRRVLTMFNYSLDLPATSIHARLFLTTSKTCSGVVRGFPTSRIVLGFKAVTFLVVMCSLCAGANQRVQ